HDRGDHGILLEPLARGEVAPGNREGVVSVPDLAGMVDRDEPVTVAVERKADRRFAGANLLLEIFAMERAAPGVDVGAVGSHADRQHAGAQTPEDLRRDAVGRAVGTVESDREAAEVEWKAGAQKVGVLALGAVEAHELADLGAARPWRP